MSMRVKAAIVIILIIFVFTVTSYFSNYYSTKNNINDTMEQDLALARNIADKLVSTKIRLLKSDAATVGERLLNAGSAGEMMNIMASQMEGFPNFTSLTVYGRENVIANVGEPIHNNIMLMEGHYIQRAFDGESIISTTHYNNVSGAFIMHVFVPMGTDMVLSATIPGTIFADRISEFRLWQSGGIFIVDEEGTIIASRRYDLVTDRRNFINEAKTDPESRKTGDFFQAMITSENGSGTYPFEGVERLCSYQRISDSAAGWRIGVLVPLRESPEANMQKDLLFSAVVFMAMGVLISILVSGFAAKPFNKIETQNKSLEELNKTVQMTSEAKTKFLATMSHEMRTALNAVIGLSELTLETGGLSREARESIEKINNAGATLLNIINDILDISKIEAEKFELVPVEYDTPGMINDAVTQSILRRGEKSIELILNIDENIPVRLYGDDLRIKQILNNLLSNAFKYTKEGTVELNVKSEPSFPAGAAQRFPVENEVVWLDISVRDTGIGIRPENIGSLFTDYTQIDIKSNRKIEGTGLGLSITKKMTAMMGGSISVESEFGKGSVFMVRLPQKLITGEPIGPDVVNRLKSFRYSAGKRDNNLRLSRVSLPYAKVLVVDDVVTNLDVAKGMIRPYKIHVDCVSSGQEAINVIRDEKVRYNAIFMDHMMPGIDGIEATRIIREEIGSEYAKTVPIIALTANAIVGNEEMFLNSGFQAFISKPIEIHRLDFIIKQWVRDEKLEKSLAAQSMEEDQRSGTDRRSGYDRRIFFQKVGGLDINMGLERFNGDIETYLQILQSFTSNTPPLFETIKKINKDNNLSLADYAIIVHGIKSSCRGIGAGIAGNQAEALEKAAKAGNMDFVTAHNSAFIETVSRLIADIEEALDKCAEKKDRPKRDRPDKEILSKLLDACKKFSIKEIDAIIQAIEEFEYEADDGLALWLRENADQMNYSEIVEKLGAFL